MPGQTQQRKKPTGRTKVNVGNQAKLDANNPIPFEHGGQAFSYINSTRYIPFLPPKDDYAKLLLESRLLSTTHNACVSKKKDFCAGNGFYDTNGKEIDQTILDWFKCMNRKNENATEINAKIFESFFTYGNVPIEIARVTLAKKKYLFVYPHEFLEWRLCAPNSDDEVTHAVQSKLFLRTGMVSSSEIKNAKKLPLYNPLNPEKKNWWRDENGVERTMIWYKNSVTGFPHYGLPSAVASMIFQILEYKGARYNLDNFDNNMVLGGILALKGSLSPDETNRIAKQIINTHTGDGRRGRVAVVSSEEGIDSSAFHNYDTSKDGSFTEADDKWTQKIILANDWDAVLAGIISPSTLGKGSGFLTKIFEIKQNTTIRPQQTRLIQGVWEHIFTIASSWLGIDFQQYSWGIKPFLDISGLTDVDITPAVQINEVRQAKGLPADPKKEGVYMKENTTVSITKTKEEGSDVQN